MSAQVAEEAVADAVGRLCRGGSWQGIARELAWRAVTAGGRDLGSLEALCAVAEAKLASMIDDAVWAAELCALRGWREYLQSCPGEEAGAVAAARLDANEEATRLIATAYADVLESLVTERNAPQPDRRGRRLRLPKHRGRETLAA